MRRLAALLGLGAAIGAGAFWFLTAPDALNLAVAVSVMNEPGDAKAGETVFWAAGCASCHAAKDETSKLGGGAALQTPFGPIYAPNISPDPDDGIGKWSAADFAHAIYDGVGVNGEHLYPAFPYPSYRRLSVPDVRDLWAYLRTLPPVKGRAPAPGFGFPFNIRRAIGVWKRVYLATSPPPLTVAPSDNVDYGRYLVLGPGHCGECHTARDALGGQIMSRALGGAPMPDGKGKAPDISPNGLKKWSEDDVETALSLGVTPDGDSLGGAMAEVVRNLGHLPKSYITAIARYLKAGG